jgi:hypothetical protein
MRLFSRGCETWQLPYAAAVDGLPLRERFDLEAHAATCPECADALRNAGAVNSALETAFAPLRESRAMLAPGRVRLALGPRPIRRAWLRAPAFFGRLAEVSVMIGVTMFAVTGTFENPQQTIAPEPRSVIEEYFRSQPPPTDDLIDYFRWLRLHPAPSENRRDVVHYPVGGRFDIEPAEIVTNRTSTPR